MGSQDERLRWINLNWTVRLVGLHGKINYKRVFSEKIGVKLLHEERGGADSRLRWFVLLVGLKKSVESI